MTNLERLNAILSNKALFIPDYRRVVTESGNNLSWLKKHLLREESLNKSKLSLNQEDYNDLVFLLKSKTYALFLLKM